MAWVCHTDLTTFAAVGILAAQCAHIRGAKQIIMIDNQQYRLDFAKQKLPYLELLNFDNTKDVVQSLKDMVPHGPDVCIEAVGFHYATSIKDKIQMALMMETDPALMLNQMIMACKKRGRLSIVSFCHGINLDNLSDFWHRSLCVLLVISWTCRHAVQHCWVVLCLAHIHVLDDIILQIVSTYSMFQALQLLLQVGVYAATVNGLNIGAFMEKGLYMAAGQTPVQAYWFKLLDLIKQGKLTPEMVITHELPLSEAAQGYQIFNDKTDNCVKVVLKPGLKASA